ncbi:Chloroperoxidase [Mycena vitilis]|nr:Chloroperoxidase [Mycena vitilis]
MVFSGVVKLFQNVYVLTWDVCLTLANALAPNRKIGAVVGKGCPGAGGNWPEFVPPGEGDSRSCCPALNALANHGILPHDGKNIKFTDITKTVQETYNFAPTFCLFVPRFMAGLLKRNYKTDTLDLADINLHNGIEHDASLIRQDTHFEPDQSTPCVPLIEELLASATGKDDTGNQILTAADLSRFSAKRRADSRAKNPEFTLDKFHQTFGSANASTLLAIFGGKVPELKALLVEERLLEGWESCARQRMGLTFLVFNRTVLKVEKGIKEDAVEAGPLAGRENEAHSS